MTSLRFNKLTTSLKSVMFMKINLHQKINKQKYTLSRKKRSDTQNWNTQLPAGCCISRAETLLDVQMFFFSISSSSVSVYVQRIYFPLWVSWPSEFCQLCQNLRKVLPISSFAVLMEHIRSSFRFVESLPNDDSRTDRNILSAFKKASI